MHHAISVLTRLGTAVPTQICACCDQPETISHMFAGCVQVERTWGWMRNFWHRTSAVDSLVPFDLDPPNQRTPEDRMHRILTQWPDEDGGVDGDIFLLLICCFLETIYDARNEVYFPPSSTPTNTPSPNPTPPLPSKSYTDNTNRIATRLHAATLAWYQKIWHNTPNDEYLGPQESKKKSAKNWFYDNFECAGLASINNGKLEQTSVATLVCRGRPL